MLNLGQRRCPHCGDTHLCPGAAITVGPPASIAEFVEQVIIPAPAGRTSVADMYDFYQQWCIWRGQPPHQGIRSFNRQLQALGMTKERIGGWFWWLGVTVDAVAYNEAMQQSVLAS